MANNNNFALLVEENQENNQPQESNEMVRPQEPVEPPLPASNTTNEQHEIPSEDEIYKKAIIIVLSYVLNAIISASYPFMLIILSSIFHTLKNSCAISININPLITSITLCCFIICILLVNISIISLAHKLPINERLKNILRGINLYWFPFLLAIANMFYTAFYVHISECYAYMYIMYSIFNSIAIVSFWIIWLHINSLSKN